MWSINEERLTRDWKRNAGATSLVNRRRARASTALPGRVVTNIRAGAIELDSAKLYFFPDRLYVARPSGVEAWSYGDIGAEHGTVRFVEGEHVPPDAKVVDHTWLYVNKDGGPDRRFNNNRQLPVALYGTLELGLGSGRGLSLQLSNVQAAQGVAGLIGLIRNTTRDMGAAPASAAEGRAFPGGPRASSLPGGRGDRNDGRCESPRVPVP